MKKKIIYFVNSFDFFLSHRIKIAESMYKKNYEVHLVCPKISKKKILKYNYIKFNFVDLPKNFIDFKVFFSSLYKFYNIINYVNPNLLHFITIKPIVIGGILKIFFLNKKKSIFSFSGLGYIFTEKKIVIKILKKIIVLFYKLLFKSKNSFFIVQNKDDYNFFKKKINLSSQKLFLIKGSGVDLNYFSFKNLKKKGKIKVTMISRLLKHKGVIEFLDLAKTFSQNNNVSFFLVGDFDVNNPSNINKDLITSMKNVKNFIYLGYKKNIKSIIYDSDIIVLPSYREGFPKVLIEAAACGRAAITTKVPGCREAVINKRTGLLIRPSDLKGLINSLFFFLKNRKLIEKFGRNARKFAIKNFDIRNVVKQHQRIYFDR